MTCGMKANFYPLWFHKSQGPSSTSGPSPVVRGRGDDEMIASAPGIKSRLVWRAVSVRASFLGPSPLQMWNTHSHTAHHLTHSVLFNFFHFSLPSVDCLPALSGSFWAPSLLLLRPLSFPAFLLSTNYFERLNVQSPARHRDRCWMNSIESLVSRHLSPSWEMT